MIPPIQLLLLINDFIFFVTDDLYVFFFFFMNCLAGKHQTNLATLGTDCNSCAEAKSMLDRITMCVIIIFDMLRFRCYSAFNEVIIS